MPVLRNIWSSVVDKIKGVAPSRDKGVEYRSFPEAPTPKMQSRSRYSIVIMSESGAARQIKLTPNRIRLMAGVAIGASAIIVLGFVGLLGFDSGDKGLRKEKDRLANRVKTLEEEIRQMELTQSVKSQAPTAGAATESAPETTEPPVEERPAPVSAPAPTEPAEARDASVAEEPAPPPTATETVPVNPPAEPAIANAPPAPVEPARPEPVPTAEASTETHPPAPISAVRQIVNFDAKNVTALREGPNSGTINFKLIKDRTEERFSGYLFVIVELVNRRGDYKILCYPKRARLGPEDMPEDYRAGETLKFKSNIEVELPYRDIRLGSSLSRLSILMYGEDGNVVFQRGFDREEIKFTKPGRAQNAKQRPGARRARHAL